MNRYAAIALGGAFGSLARYAVGSLVTEQFTGTGFWIGTFAVNISACMILGCVLTVFSRHTGIGESWRYLLPVGFIGAYSTFSTFEWELFSGLRSGAYMLCASYMVASIFLGLLGVWAGERIAGWF